MHVPLRLTEIRVTRELLDGHHGRAAHGQVTAERVTQDVERARDGEPRSLARVLYPLLKMRDDDARAALVAEHVRATQVAVS